MRVVETRGVASVPMRGIRAGFLEEVLSDFHLKEGIGDSQVKKDKEGIWGRGTHVGRDLETKRRNSTPSGIFKKLWGLDSTQ